MSCFFPLFTNGTGRIPAQPALQMLDDGSNDLIAPYPRQIRK
ncbi:MAG: hypothetical protein WCT04_17105 [Planctomycetota bacterium]